jgi:hypothetical protein
MSPYPMPPHGATETGTSPVSVMSGHMPMHVGARSALGPAPPGATSSTGAAAGGTGRGEGGRHSAPEAASPSNSGLRGQSEMAVHGARPLQETMSWPAANQASNALVGQQGHHTVPGLPAGLAPGGHQAHTAAAQPRWPIDSGYVLSDRSGQPLPRPPGVLQQAQLRPDSSAGRSGPVAPVAMPMAVGPSGFLPSAAEMYRWPSAAPRIPLSNLPPGNLPAHQQHQLQVMLAVDAGGPRALGRMPYIGWPAHMLMPAQSGMAAPLQQQQKHAANGQLQEGSHAVAEVCVSD